MMKLIRQAFALLVAAPMFVFLAWLFGIFMQPDGAVGAGIALLLVLGSAILSLLTYRWLSRDGPKLYFRNRGVDGIDNGVGIGMMGLSQHGQADRRRDDHPGDHYGSSGPDGGEDDGSY